MNAQHTPFHWRRHVLQYQLHIDGCVCLRCGIIVEKTLKTYDATDALTIECPLEPYDTSQRAYIRHLESA